MQASRQARTLRPEALSAGARQDDCFIITVCYGCRNEGLAAITGSPPEPEARDGCLIVHGRRQSFEQRLNAAFRLTAP